MHQFNLFNIPPSLLEEGKENVQNLTIIFIIHIYLGNIVSVESLIKNNLIFPRIRFYSSS